MFALAIWSKKHNQKDYYENNDGLYHLTRRIKGKLSLKTNIKEFL